MNDKAGTPVPRELRMLRSGTNAYFEVLKGAYPTLVGLNERIRATGAEDEMVEALITCVRTSLLDGELVGTVASIAQALAHLLGEDR